MNNRHVGGVISKQTVRLVEFCVLLFCRVERVRDCHEMWFVIFTSSLTAAAYGVTDCTLTPFMLFNLAVVVVVVVIFFQYNQSRYKRS